MATMPERGCMRCEHADDVRRGQERRRRRARRGRPADDEHGPGEADDRRVPRSGRRARARPVARRLDGQAPGPWWSRRLRRPRACAGGQGHDVLLAGALAAGSSPAMRPSRMTTIRSLIPISSGSSEEIISTAAPARASSRISSWMAGLGADVDAAGRLVEEQHPRRDGQPLGQDDLLLVAAGQEADLLLEARGHAARRPGEQLGPCRRGAARGQRRRERARARAGRCRAPTGRAPGPRPCGPR